MMEAELSPWRREQRILRVGPVEVCRLFWTAGRLLEKFVKDEPVGVSSVVNPEETVMKYQKEG